jgi:hypothetical protein
MIRQGRTAPKPPAHKQETRSSFCHHERTISFARSQQPERRTTGGQKAGPMSRTHNYTVRGRPASQATRSSPCLAGEAVVLTTPDRSVNSVPLLRRSSVGLNRLAGHCLYQAVAHYGEKCGRSPVSESNRPDATRNWGHPVLKLFRRSLIVGPFVSRPPQAAAAENQPGADNVCVDSLRAPLLNIGRGRPLSGERDRPLPFGARLNGDQSLAPNP